MARPLREGRIITFYSYKGGVGRTMALANVAFLAANNGHRVLVMDWDLEAPGLPYYFRGLLEAPEARALKESPGILDLVWDWTSSLQGATTAADTQSIFERFDDPDVFSSYVRGVLRANDENDPDDVNVGRLDFINAGSPKVKTTASEPVDYVDALAHFSWPSFFSDYAGGSVLENLRRWAKRNYDFILIDSRTGLADVSGICTTQMPDGVALCFILNRQNIDGVARVAAAIRTRRQDEIELHAVPMRVAIKGTAEEDDARARGILELSKIGGFSEDAVSDDFKILSIRAGDNVPYYETLAQITATDPTTDPLCLNYARLASRLLDTPIDLPQLNPAWIDMVRRRLQPRHATIDYVTKLMASDSARAIKELESLLESAFDTVIDGGDLSDDYVTALVEASLFLASRGDGPFVAVDMLHRTLDLLRALAAAQPEKWRSFLTMAIERNVETLSFYLDPEEELALLEELDGLLADANTVANRLRRLTHRRRAARLYILQSELEAASQTIGECLRLIKAIGSGAPKLAADQLEQVQAAEIETMLFRGEIAEKQENWSKAFYELTTALAGLSSQDLSGRSEFARLAFELHNRLARLPADIFPADEAAHHAVLAAKHGALQAPGSMVIQFVDLAQVIVRANKPDLALEFCDHALDGQDRRMLLQNANYWGRIPRTVAIFFQTATDLAWLMAGSPRNRAMNTVAVLGETALMVWRTLDRRRHTIGGKTRESLTEPLTGLLEALTAAGAPLEIVAHLQDAAAVSAGRRPSTPQS